ncbi:UNVERIFIED_CONTAM: hypothetical protein HDU68_002688 [Siphonaria sp. JEL0065]|nr:hypothetical protein HDU68_002688 [Siphonaria sp. JEL0065]
MPVATMTRPVLNHDLKTRMIQTVIPTTISVPQQQQPTAFCSKLQQQAKLYLFAYGSLINPLSLKRTIGRNESACPVRVSGFKRSWGFNCIRRSYTAVSIASTGSSNDMVNGVLIPVSFSDLVALDEREAGYERKQLVAQDIASYDTTASATFLDLENSTIFAYVLEDQDNGYESDSSVASTNSNAHTACPKVPIPQSYIDCILAGALLQHGTAFARDFVEWTQGWQGHWINDRYASHSVKRYIPNTQAGEGELEQSLAESVDLLLASLVPSAFEARVQV